MLDGQGRTGLVSPHNFAPEVATPSHPVTLHDITLRDGEECADVALGAEDKLAIAEALCAVGLRRIELFLTVPGWLEVVRQYMARQLPAALYVTWRPGRIERALDLGVKHVMVWFRASDEYQRAVIKRDRTELLDEALASVAQAKAAGLHVNFFMPESTRTTLEQLRDAVQAAERAGADAVTLVDSLSIARPAAIAYLVRKLTEWVHIPVEVHCHNDFGLATASVLAAYEAGASVIHTAVNGLGYRAGNSSLDEVAVPCGRCTGWTRGSRWIGCPGWPTWCSGSRVGPTATSSRSSERGPSATSNGGRCLPWSGRGCGRWPSPSSLRWSGAACAWSSASGATWRPSNGSFWSWG